MTLRTTSSLRSNAAWSAHVAPAEESQPFFPDRLFDDGFHRAAHRRRLRQEQHADAIAPFLGQGDFQGRRLGAQQGVWHLDQDSGTVPGHGIGAHRPAVVEVDQDLQSLTNDLVAFSVLEINNKADATGIMLFCRIVKPLSVGKRM